MNRGFVNVIILGFGFMFLFTAFQTMGNIEKTVLDSIAQDDPTFKGDGYTSLAIIYAVFAIFNWFVPSIITASGPRVCILIGAVTYCFFVTSFLFPSTWLLYLSSAILGIGAALIWTGQGNYLSKCSDPSTISRNSGIFWAMFQMSLFLGNTFVYFVFQGKEKIDAETRLLVFSVLIGVAILGVIFLLCLRSAQIPETISAADSDDKEIEIVLSPIETLKNAVKFFFTKDMLLLSVCFLYTGLELSFFSGVYSPSIGFTLAIGSNAKQLVGMSGILIGLGAVLGGATFGILGKKTNRWGRDPIVIMGFILHMIAFFLIFLNLPNNAPFGDTNDESFLSPPRVWIALLCSFLLGFGDSCFNTQIYSLLGGVFASKSADAFAIFKFTQSIAAAAAFFYSSQFGLRTQMGILIVFGILGTACYCIEEYSLRKSGRSNSTPAISPKEK
uniref:UNC93-like protein MFSD11 n=1 Tax=Culicoides sonorensis TaxID=179676 RepID=A0A336MQ22_CULSO